MLSKSAALPWQIAWKRAQYNSHQGRFMRESHPHAARRSWSLGPHNVGRLGDSGRSPAPVAPAHVVYSPSRDVASRPLGNKLEHWRGVPQNLEARPKK